VERPGKDAASSGRLAGVESLILECEQAWSSGKYVEPGGEVVASFQSDGRVVEITDEASQHTLRVVRCRDRFGIKGSPGPPWHQSRLDWFRRAFALVDARDETLGLLRPRSTVVASKWLIRLETADDRATLRARTARTRWDAERVEKRLLFDLSPATVGAASFSFGWTEEGQQRTQIDVANVHGTLRLLVVAAPLCLPLAGLVGFSMISPSGA
jgi:hypothetical protein